MMFFLASAGQLEHLASQESFHNLPNAMASFRTTGGQYDISYTTTNDQDCDARIPATHPNRDFQDALCANGPDAATAAPHLLGNALCAPVSDLQAICSAIEECHSVSFHQRLMDSQGTPHGYLNTYACALAANIDAEPGTDMYTKVVDENSPVPDDPACPLGVGAEVVAEHYPEVEGLYEKVDANTYASMDSLAQISWEQNGNCGWKVERAVWAANLMTHGVPVKDPPDTSSGIYSESAGERRLSKECEDNDELANKLFGFGSDDEEYTPGLCALSAGQWGSAAYCANPVFAAFCPLSCGCKGGSADKAAAALGKLGGAMVADCSAADCADEHFAFVCQETCDQDKAAPADAKVLRRRVQKFRAQMRDQQINWKHGHRARTQAEHTRRQRKLSEEHRRLGWSANDVWEEVLRTYPETAGCTDLGAADDTLLASDLYDIIAYHAPVQVDLEHSCPGGKTTWNTTDDGFCLRGNHPVRYNAMPDIVENGCWLKCTKGRGSPKTEDSIDDNDVNDYCSGNQDDFEEDTDALCLPREECERICDALGDQCDSFDMHKRVPQCYLNLPGQCTFEGQIRGTRQWEKVEKALTPGVESATSTDDQARDTYTTYTGQNCTAIDPTATPDGQGRDNCEALCSADNDCTGFVIWGGDNSANGGGRDDCWLMTNECRVRDMWYISTTFLSGGTPNTDRMAWKTVVKNPHERCKVTITVSAGADYYYADGEYFKLESDNGEFYLSTDNSTRLRFVEGGGAACDQWYLEKNIDPLSNITLKNCSDSPRAANDFLEMYQNEQEMHHPCQWGHDSGLCDDPVFNGVCPHTCGNFSEMRGFLYQVHPDASGGAGDHECLGDNDEAAYEWLLAYGGRQGVRGGNYERAAMIAALGNAAPGACAALAAENNTHQLNPCTQMPYSHILSTLCKASCPSYPRPAPDGPLPRPNETSSVGAGPVDRDPTNRRMTPAWFRQRQLGHAPAQPGLHDGMHPPRNSYYYEVMTAVDPPPSAYTVSGAGSVPDTIVIEYLDGRHTNNANWVRFLQSYRPGSDDADSPYAGAVLDYNGTAVTVTAGTACPMTTSIGDQEMFDQLTRSEMYLYEAPLDADAAIAHECRTAAECPELTTCILAPLRFRDSLDTLFNATESPPTGFLKDHSLSEYLDFANSPPKVLITDYRATGIWSQHKWEMTPTIFRDVPAATRVTVTAWPAGADKVTITLVSPSLAKGYYAFNELGRHYALPTGFDEWSTDVIRVEAFDKNNLPVNGKITVDIATHIKGDEPQGPGLESLFVLFKYDADSAVAPVQQAASLSGGVASVQLEAGFDYAGASATDHCADPHSCDPNADCFNSPGAERYCVCKAAYAGSGEPGFCALRPLDYLDSEHDYYLRIKHDAPLAVGWQVNQIELFEDDDCSVPVPANWQVNFPVEQSTTYNKITKHSQTYTGEIGYSRYPHGADADAVDGQYVFGNINLWTGAGSWRSECLQCSPHDPVAIEFIVGGGTKVSCVRVSQSNAQKHSRALTVERGPAGIKHPDGAIKCGMGEGQQRCEPSMTWSVDSGDDAVAAPDVVMTCGRENTQIFGELLLFVESDGGKLEGAYMNDHPVTSACHCHQLCADHLHEGCTSYKYYDTGAFKHCYLQSSVFSSGNGFYGKAASADQTISQDWTSGEVAKRHNKDGKVYDQPWVLSHSGLVDGAITVSGIGLPSDGADLQRLKLVAAGASCLSAVPAEVEGIACVESTRSVTFTMREGQKKTSTGTDSDTVYTFCGPKPTSSTPKSATFGGIEVTAMTMEMGYDVCYCAYDCFDAVRWQKVGEPLAVAGSAFTWTSEPATVYRKDETTNNTVEITVTRPITSQTSSVARSNNEDWELKLVREWFDCSLDIDAALFTNESQTPSSTWGPDAATFVFTLTVEAADAGDYAACYREGAGGVWTHIPQADGTKYLTIHKLAADRTHPAGIFHNQYFSVLAGSKAALPLKVDGKYLALPSSSRITMTKGACGDMETHEFAGAVEKAESDDVTAPQFVEADSEPASGETVSATQQVRLAFSEPVAIDAENCTGSFVWYSGVAGADTIAVHCSEASKYTVFDNYVLLSPPFVAASQYVLSIETGVLTDLAGNAITLTVTSYEIDAAATDAYAPKVLYSNPENHGSIPVGENGTTVSVYFSEDVSLVTSPDLATLTFCGSDFTCDSDDEIIETYTLDATMITSNVLTVTLGPAIRDFNRYKLTIPASAVEDSSSNAGPAAASEIEFVLDSNGFSADNAVAVAAEASDGSALTFHVQLSKDTAPGAYNLCFCSEQDDGSLENFGDGENTYTLEADKEAGAADELAPPANATIKGQPIADHLCDAKCAKGCIGADCYCDGLAGAGANTLCLPKELCSQACDQADGCEGIQVHDVKNQCTLLGTTTPTLSVNEELQVFTRHSGTACTHASDFSEQAGKLFVTNRVEVGVDYIFTPGQPGSIELTGPDDASFDYLDGHHGTLSKDRITVIDCGGTCGVSSPTASVTLGDGNAATHISAWNNFWPFTYFNDKPAEHIEGGPDDTSEHHEILETYAAKSNAHGYYGEDECSDLFTGRYCPGANLDATKDTPYQAMNGIPVHGIKRSLNEHQCYAKCGAGSDCVGDWCHCDGLFSGYDTEDSNAICADVDLCQEICDNIDDCTSIDMHATLPRCYLNSNSCSDYTLTGLAADANYNLLVKKNDPNDEPPQGCHRRLAAPARELEHDLLPTDEGYSWSKMLRFKDLTFNSGGTFKLCFCDSHLAKQGVCATAADYSVEVGTIHSSGVSCLLANPRLQRVACASQYHHGNLRCYSHLAQAPDPAKPLYGEPMVGGGAMGPGAGAAAVNIDGGLYHPEETGGRYVGGFHGAD
jgi:hypothetical protein